MLRIHCTKRVESFLKLDFLLDGSADHSPGLLRDWYINIFSVGYFDYFVLVNVESLYSFYITAPDEISELEFKSEIAEHILGALSQSGLSERQIQLLKSEYTNTHLVKTSSGSMRGYLRSCAHDYEAQMNARYYNEMRVHDIYEYDINTLRRKGLEKGTPIETVKHLLANCLRSKD